MLTPPLRLADSAKLAVGAGCDLDGVQELVRLADSDLLSVSELCAVNVREWLRFSIVAVCCCVDESDTIRLERTVTIDVVRRAVMRVRLRDRERRDDDRDRDAVPLLAVAVSCAETLKLTVSARLGVCSDFDGVCIV